MLSEKQRDIDGVGSIDRERELYMEVLLYNKDSVMFVNQNINGNICDQIL